MSESSGAPVLYHVTYSQRVRSELLRLGERAKAAGYGKQFFAAVKEIDRLLHLYPQFGQPLYDLKHQPMQVCIGVVPPLVLRFGIHQERRLVMVAYPMLPLPRCGF